jgi:hypothetical protein
MIHLIANSFIKNANLAVVLSFVHEGKKKVPGFFWYSSGHIARDSKVRNLGVDGVYAGVLWAMETH